MNPIWAEALAQIRDQLNERVSRFFKDDDLLVQFNRAQLFFARETKFFRKEVELAIQGDGITVALPPDFLGIIAVGLKGTEEGITFLPLLGMHGRSQDSLMGFGYFLKANDRIGLSSPLDTPADNKILLSYYAKPKVLVSSADDLNKELDVLEEYIDTVIQIVVMRSYFKRREHEEYQFQKQEVETLLARDIKAEHRKMGTRTLNIAL